MTKKIYRLRSPSTGQYWNGYRLRKSKSPAHWVRKDVALRHVRRSIRDHAMFKYDSSVAGMILMRIKARLGLDSAVASFPVLELVEIEVTETELRKISLDREYELGHQLALAQQQFGGEFADFMESLIADPKTWRMRYVVMNFMTRDEVERLTELMKQIGVKRGDFVLSKCANFLATVDDVAIRLKLAGMAVDKVIDLRTLKEVSYAMADSGT
jgi:hypothetical protein